MTKIPKDIVKSSNNNKHKAEFDWYASAYKRFSIAERKSQSLEDTDMHKFLAARIKLMSKLKSAGSNSA
jgi:hypothetical protein